MMRVTRGCDRGHVGDVLTWERYDLFMSSAAPNLPREETQSWRWPIAVADSNKRA